MQPGFELRLTTMMKALSETVLPAVDAHNKAAVEQMHIVIGSLALLREQIDFAHWFEVEEARDMAGLIMELAALAALPPTASATDTARRSLALAERHDIRLSTLREANVDLRAMISLLIEEAAAAGDDSLFDRTQALVLAHGKRQIGRERAFVAGTNFDVFPDTLQTIEETLQQPAASRT
jgi:hypothetical protein